jgi:ABC-type transport system involved in multi-copper enzyme maturation permease subunit
MRKVWVVARVQAAKLRRRKIIWLFGLAPFLLSLLVAGPTIILMTRPEVKQAGMESMFTWGLILGWGGFLSLAGRVFALILGAMTVDRDIRDGTLFPVLAKPISRAETLMGKYLGSALIMAVYLAFEALIMVLAMTQAGVERQWLPVMNSLLADVFVFGAVLALGLCLGVVLRPALGLGLAFVSLIWMQLTAPLLNSEHPVWYTLGVIPPVLFPRAGEMAIWLDVTSSAHVDAVPIMLRIGYAVAWTLLLLTLTLWRFERRDLVR